MIITPQEAMALGIWETICDVKGINVWAVNEGLMDSDKQLTITLGEIDDYKTQQQLNQR